MALVKVVKVVKTRLSDVVCAVFATREAADRAWDLAIARGYAPADISIVMSDAARKKYFYVERPPAGNKGLKGAGAGGLIGTTVGAIAGVLAIAASSIVVPGLGLVLAGPIVAALAGAGAGAAVGSVLGGLIGMGVPEKKVKLIENHVKLGRIVLTVKARSMADANAIERDWMPLAVEVLR